MTVATQPELPPLAFNYSNKYTYVILYKVKWSKEHGQPRKVAGKTRTIGKIVGGGKEGLIEWNDDFLKEYPELENFYVHRVLIDNTGSKPKYELKFKPVSDIISLSKAVNLKRLQAGATWTLDNVIASSPLTIALERVFRKYNIHKKLLSIAYYFYLTSSNVTDLYYEFAQKTRLPFHRPLDSSQISRLFNNITDDDIDKYLKTINKIILKEEEKCQDKQQVNTYYALDSTSISTHAKKIDHAQWGHNKDGDDLKQVNILMLVNQRTGQPVYYREYAGNTPDVSTISHTLKEYARMELNRNAILVTDRGYSSVGNIHKCLRNEQSFIMNIKTNLSFTKFLIVSNYENLIDPCNYNSTINCNCFMEKIEWKYPGFYKTASGRKVSEKAELYVHIYFDKDINNNSDNYLTSKIIAPIIEKLKNNITLTPEEQKNKDLFIIENPDKTYKSNRKNITEYMITKGVRILISDVISDSVECWQAYHERERVEEAFSFFKQQVGGNRFRTSKTTTTRGKIFTLFLACSIGLMFRLRMKQAREKGINFPYDSDTKILAKLNLIEQTIFNGGAYYSEVVGKTRKILEALDIPIPDTEIFDDDENTETENIPDSFSEDLDDKKDHTDEIDQALNI